MAKLYYYYGTMGASKTAMALMTNYNYEERGQKPLLLKPEMDTRDKKNIIRSRIGIENRCMLLENFMERVPAEDIHETVKSERYKTVMKAEQFPYDCIILDECQFATKDQIRYLSDIVDYLDIPVVCFGLRADFKGELFEGSRELLTIADTIQEVKSVCWCGKKAVWNVRYNQDGIVKDGDQILIGADECYQSLCRKHYKMDMLSPNWRNQFSRKISDEEDIAF